MSSKKYIDPTNFFNDKMYCGGSIIVIVYELFNLFKCIRFVGWDKL